MNISWITLRDLEYLVAVAEFQHFGKAAKHCHVSQPSLSTQIKKIEDVLGVTLFERTNRRVSITPVGQRVTLQAQTVLQEAQQIAAVLGKDTKPMSGEFKLGTIATLGPYYTPYFLGPIRKQFPDLNLILREGLTHQLLAELKAGNLDAVLAAPTFDETGFKTFPIFFEPFVLATPKGHALSHKKPLKGSDLKATEMVLLEDGHCLRDQTIETCHTNRRGNIKQFHATSIETLRHLVASGLGYTLLPKLAVKDHPMKDLVDYREFEQTTIGRDIILVCRESYPKLEQIKLLTEFLKKTSTPTRLFK